MGSEGAVCAALLSFLFGLGACTPTSPPCVADPSTGRGSAAERWNEVDTELGDLTVPHGAYVRVWQDVPGHAMFWVSPMQGVLVVIMAIPMEPGTVEAAGAVLSEYLKLHVGNALSLAFPEPTPRPEAPGVVCSFKDRAYACASARKTSVVVGYALNPKSPAFERSGGLGLLAKLVSTAKAIEAGKYSLMRHAP